MNSNNINEEISNLDPEHLLLLTLLRLNQSDPINSLTKVQKIVFLAQRGGLEEDPISDPIESYFEFRSEKYGPYSTGISEKLDELAESGLINKKESEHSGRSEYAYSIDDLGHTAVKQRREEIPIDELRTLKLAKRFYNNIPTAQLLDKLYDEFPNYEGTR